ncbi:MAG TPA: 2-oxoglutarate dehydrogenase E1 component [Vicinamibacterales bacterium]|nr:2-oxoglutarate dehydrogenase E1 component [Vicinamibacterales bacterium]HOQ59182.1 2-oxoglutarate dehydrogenase E1 component [Vicinamibacterales bacterium]HPK70756.1 2-oxoglutarate dehydrogenase E1 component [Vicinamibacterales bacterium]
MDRWQQFSGINEGYVLELYERYLTDPASVDAATREIFARWNPAEREAAPPASDALAEPASARPASVSHAKAVGAVGLAESIRRYGHLAAHVDPLGAEPPGDPSLHPEAHGVTRQDLDALPASLSPIAPGDGLATMADVVNALRRVYCSTTGYDYAHVFVPEERRWLRHAAETGRFRAPADPIDPVALLERLTEVEVFERFLHRTFPGKTRFSIEGLDMLVPILDEVIGDAAEAGVRSVFIGMAHRGRLNVMAHVLHRPVPQILTEFMDPVSPAEFHEDMAWTGDVTYHAGAHRAIKHGREIQVVVSMPPNPSHLEAVDPVVEGMSRAAGTDGSQAGAPRVDASRSLPILIHGDAAFAGQGVVAETLNLGRLAGYSTGGTIHIIVNNQVGFTATARESYSTSYASGLARGFKIPIVHVNADDPEACVEAARLAIAYRTAFHRDFLIDLVGYRRRGHNEGDEPAFTQPLLYDAIASHPTVRERWARTLVERGTVAAGAPDALVAKHMDRLQRAMDALEPERNLAEAPPPAPPGAASRASTSVPLDALAGLNAALLAGPAGFTAHRKLARLWEKRAQIFADPDARSIDWAAAETLAFASILADGTPIRLTGEDAARGTFSHRHAVLHDARTGRSDVPLQRLPQARAAFDVHNSPLSEYAAVGFEFGYNLQAPSHLVLWEGQYGDFINGAQIAVDEYVVSARGKWGSRPSLVLLLPHGHEGAGPDHSSARPERFLQLAAGINMRVVNCTTAAQYFHLLRRQAALLLEDPLPLVVLTPKSLLRHPMVASSPRELAEGQFRPLINDDEAKARAGGIRRVVLCTGKVYVDLAGSDRRAAAPHVALCRLEQLYPIAPQDLRAMLDGYPAAEEIVWVQEEPANMGYWDFVGPRLTCAAGGRPVRLVARPRSASPAEGSAARHGRMQRILVEAAFAPVKPADCAEAGGAPAAARTAG